MLALGQLIPFSAAVVGELSVLQRVPSLVVAMRPPPPVAKQLAVVGQLIAAKAADEPAWGSVVRSNASAQDVPPSGVLKTRPGAVEAVAKQTVAVAQLTPVSPPT